MYSYALLAYTLVVCAGGAGLCIHTPCGTATLTMHSIVCVSRRCEYISTLPTSSIMMIIIMVQLVGDVLVYSYSCSVILW